MLPRTSGRFWRTGSRLRRPRQPPSLQTRDRDQDTEARPQSTAVATRRPREAQRPEAAPRSHLSSSCTRRRSSICSPDGPCPRAPSPPWTSRPKQSATLPATSSCSRAAQGLSVLREDTPTRSPAHCPAFSHPPVTPHSFGYVTPLIGQWEPVLLYPAPSSVMAALRPQAGVWKRNVELSVRSTVGFGGPSSLA